MITKSYTSVVRCIPRRFVCNGGVFAIKAKSVGRLILPVYALV